MTVASECVIAHQLGLAYAVCVVDNLALAWSNRSREDFEAGKRPRVGARPVSAVVAS
jgi:hypothetical protein